MGRISNHVRSNVYGLIAVFIAFSGTAYAVDGPLPGRNQVGEADIINNEVTSADVRNDTLGGGGLSATDLRTNSVRGQEVLNGSLTGFDVVESTFGQVPNAGALDGIDSDAFWQLAGNAGTSPATDFFGTTDDQPVNLRVNNARALRLEPNATSPNVIGGFAGNAVTPGAGGATIGGGGDAAFFNRVTDNFGTIGGGRNNRVGDDTAADRPGNTVAGGVSNIASGSHAAVGGGFLNTANGLDATVGGGSTNTAGGSQSTVPGGQSNVAVGQYSLAAGQRAQAVHQGTFVWGDSTGANIASTAANQFVARAEPGFFLTSTSTVPEDQGLINTSAGADVNGAGGAFLSEGGVWTDVSDENLKEHFAAIRPRSVLAKVGRLPVRSWNYEAEPGVRHMGPVAQDFHAAFGLGGDDHHIAALDANGVALAAIKRLATENRRQDRRIAQLEEALQGRR